MRQRFEDNLYTDKTYTAYHRAFLNLKDGKSIPEIQTEDTTEYVEVLLNDNLDGLSFFLVEPDIEALADTYFKARVGIYFAVNLDKLYSTVSERAVEYIHRDVIDQLKSSRFKIVDLTTGLRAFEAFGFVDGTDNMEPFYLLKITTEIEYQYNECEI